MDRHGLVSVVLPIYRVEPYLERCITSIVNQTYSHLEIILVDDGSPDRCPQICDDWAKKDRRIKVIHKQNAGLGMARNTGIEHATGEYICFFDSDDYVALDTIEKAYTLARKDQSDIVIFGLSTIDANGKKTASHIPNTERSYYTGKEIQQVFLPDLIAPSRHTKRRTNLWMSACICLYSQRLIQRAQWRFVSEQDVISEDVYSLLCLYKDVQSVSVLPEALYCYCENAESLTHTYRKDRLQRINSFYNLCLSTCNKLHYSPEVAERFVYLYLSNTIGAMQLIARADLPEAEKRGLIRDIVMDPQMQTVLAQTCIRYETATRKLLLVAMRRKWAFLTYCFVKWKASA